MKKIVICLCSLALIFLLILAAYTLYGRSVRKTELDNALSSGMQKAMQMLNAEEYAPTSNEEFIALFMEAFLMNFESSSDVTVTILDADYEKGLLSAEAVLTFKHPIGTEGKVAVRKTIIREEYTEDLSSESFTIQYMVDGQVYKRYVLQKGSALIVPVEPSGGTFLGWRDMNGSSVMNLDGKIVDGSYTFVAVFE